MSSHFQIKQGDTSPAIRYELSPSSITLMGATVRFRMKSIERQIVLDVPAVIEQTTNPPIVSYEWASSDTATPGVYHGEFRVTYADSTIETFPNCEFFTVNVCRNVTGS